MTALAGEGGRSGTAACSAAVTLGSGRRPHHRPAPWMVPTTKRLLLR